MTTTFTVTEEKGSLPYTLIYWSGVGFPVTNFHATLDEAIERLKYLRGLKIKASILINITDSINEKLLEQV